MQQSILNQKITITDLVNTNQLRELCAHYADLFGIGIKIFAEEGGRLVDIRVGEKDYFAYLFQFSSLKKLLTETVTKLQNISIPEYDQPVLVACESGVSYWIHALTFQGDLIGRLVFGPYRAKSQQTLSPIIAQELGVDVTHVTTVWENISEFPEDIIRRIVKYFSSSLDIITFAAGKSLMTSHLHVESTTAAYRELEAKNRQLANANQRLQELDKLKSNFVATVSHELRTPLTSVIGYSEMLLENMAGPLNDEQREYVHTILEKGENLLSLITQVLDLSRIESGLLEMSYQLVRFPELLHLAVSDIGPQAQKKNILVCEDIQEDLKPIMIDQNKVRRVLTNLLSNAVKFSEEGAKITVIVQEVEEPPHLASKFKRAYDIFEPQKNLYLHVQVADTGIGIPAEYKERVFDSFFQIDNTSTRQYGGSGLGLAISKNFVEAHKGSIWVESNQDGGSVFQFLVPYIPEQIAEETHQAPSLFITH